MRASEAFRAVKNHFHNNLFYPIRQHALIQPYSGHASRQSLEVYSRLAIAEAQEQYNNVMERFPV